MNHLSIVTDIDNIKKHKHKTYRKRDLRDINNVVVHHSASDNMSISEIEYLHVDIKDWPAIAYHYVIDFDCNVHQLHPHDARIFSSGTASRNSIAICCLGNFERHVPSPKLYKTLALLLAAIVSDSDIDGFTFHKDHAPTACPGKFMSKHKLRKLVNEILSEGVEVSGADEQVGYVDDDYMKSLKDSYGIEIDDHGEEE